MRATVKYNIPNIKQGEAKIQRSLMKTADAIKTDLTVDSQTMPFDTGQLQNRSTFVDASDISSGTVRIVSDTPYARRLYFHPEYSFSTRDNPNAGAKWFEPYITGAKKDYVQKLFERFLRKEMGG